MGHLLSTVNPEAAERMNTGPSERLEVPGPGSIVVYTMRPGHSRMGRNRFPAFVMGPSQHGRGIDLLVFVDAGDMIDEQMVEKAAPGTEAHCWDWADDGAALIRGMRGTLAALHVRIGEAEDRIKAIEAVVLGDFAPPKVSIIHIMQDFENRLRSEANERQAFRENMEAAALGTPSAKFPAKRGPKKGAKKSTKRK